MEGGLVDDVEGDEYDPFSRNSCLKSCNLFSWVSFLKACITTSSVCMADVLKVAPFLALSIKSAFFSIKFGINLLSWARATFLKTSFLRVCPAVVDLSYGSIDK